LFQGLSLLLAVVFAQPPSRLAAFTAALSVTLNLFQGLSLRFEVVFELPTRAA
jgi:hypothetical protein